MAQLTPDQEKYFTDSISNIKGNIDALKSGNSTAPITPLPTAPSTINSSMLGQSPVNIPVPTTQPPVVTATQTPPVNVADQILKDTAVADTATQTKATDLSSAISQALPGLLGESADKTQALQAAGVVEKKQTLQNINSQILKKQAELQQSDTQLIADSRAQETRDTLLPFAQSAQAKLAGDAAIMRALKTSEIGVLNAQAIAAQGNVQLAQETAQQAVDAKYAPIKEQIANYQAQLTALAPILTRDEKKQADAQQLKVNLALKKIDQKTQDEKDINDLIINATSQGASQSLISDAMAIAKKGGSKLDVASTLGQYSGDFIQQQLIRSQISKNNAEAAKDRASITGSGTIKSVDVNNIVSELPAQKKNSTALTVILDNPKIGQTTRTNIANSLGVLTAIDKLATNNSNGQFGGISPLNTILDAKIPFTGIGLPGRAAAQSKQGIDNYGDINAINLKVQQWASGASLTKQQTEQVAEFTPAKSDTDRVVREKINNLTNFMLTQAQSQLQSEGINFIPQKVDYFDVTKDDIKNMDKIVNQ